MRSRCNPALERKQRPEGLLSTFLGSNKALVDQQPLSCHRWLCLLRRQRTPSKSVELSTYSAVLRKRRLRSSEQSVSENMSKTLTKPWIDRGRSIGML